MAAPTTDTRGASPAPEDELSARALEALAWTQKNARWTILGLASVVILVGGLLYYRSYSEDRRARAASDFMQVEVSVQSGNVQLARRDLESFIARYDGTIYADEARLALARLYLDAREPARAVETLQPAAADLDAPLGVQAALLLGVSYQSAERYAEAVEVYRRVSREAPLDYRRREALERLALVHAGVGDHADAAGAYREILASLPDDSPERPYYEMRLAESEARARAAAR
ncbi:MAG: YfgM family protein [Longimicrobiaceae bacterium]